LIALLATLMLAAPPAADPAPPPPKPPADVSKAVDENGVPAWAKRKHMAPVQNCTGRPNIGIETWRAERDPNSKVGAPKPVPTKTTCK
jgi:hypothetical protein